MGRANLNPTRSIGGSIDVTCIYIREDVVPLPNGIPSIANLFTSQRLIIFIHIVAFSSFLQSARSLIRWNDFFEASLILLDAGRVSSSRAFHDISFSSPHHPSPHGVIGGAIPRARRVCLGIARRRAAVVGSLGCLFLFGWVGPPQAPRAPLVRRLRRGRRDGEARPRGR